MKEKIENTRKAFTLVELLVVIAIVAILAGILLPVIAKSKTKAKVATARFSIKDLDAAIKAYRTDYQRFPIPANYPRNLVGDSSSGYIFNNNDHSTVGCPNSMYNKEPIYRVPFPRFEAAAPPSLRNSYTLNSDIMYILMNDTNPNGTNPNGARNPKKNVYLTPKELGPEAAAGQLRREGVSSDKRRYRDPFGNRYKISMDLNRDGYCYDYYYSSKIGRNTGGQLLALENGLTMHNDVKIYNKYLNQPYSTGALKVSYQAYKGDVMIWTAGPDREIEGMAGFPKGNVLGNVSVNDKTEYDQKNNPDIDNIKSWD